MSRRSSLSSLGSSHSGIRSEYNDDIARLNTREQNYLRSKNSDIARAEKVVRGSLEKERKQFEASMNKYAKPKGKHVKPHSSHMLIPETKSRSKQNGGTSGKTTTTMKYPAVATTDYQQKYAATNSPKLKAKHIHVVKSSPKHSPKLSHKNSPKSSPKVQHRKKKVDAGTLGSKIKKLG